MFDVRPMTKSATIAIFCFLLATALCAQSQPLFYKGQSYGSEGMFNPVYSFLNYTYDTLQVPRSFDDKNLSARWRQVRWNLGHPRSAIELEGGWNAFVKRQILPFGSNEGDWLPNYTLHLLGGGMTWQKNAEWLEHHGFPLPRLTSLVLVTAAELFQEVIEKKSTLHDDEIADVYLFRPAGILLFAWGGFARFAADTLRLQSWGYQPMYEPGQGQILNAGENFVIRPNILKSEAFRPFAYFGMTNLFGFSHSISETDNISWGIGGAMVKAKPAETRFSGGLFWDRNNSLLASMIVNGTDDLAARLNIYPGAIFGKSAWSPGIYVGIEDGFKGASLGFAIRYTPIGVAGGKGRQ